MKLLKGGASLKQVASAAVLFWPRLQRCDESLCELLVLVALGLYGSLCSHGQVSAR